MMTPLIRLRGPILVDETSTGQYMNSQVDHKKNSES